MGIIKVATTSTIQSFLSGKLKLSKPKPKIAVAGVGYVGLVTAVTLADIGHDVICLDIDKNKLKMLNEGVSPIYEYGLEELMHKNRERLTFTM